jgi:hypothetical protein
MWNALLGDYDKVEVDYKQAINIKSNNTFTLRLYARHLLKTNRYEEAEKILLEIESIRPDWSACRSLRAVLYLLRDEKDKVIEEDILKYDQFVADIILKNRDAVILYLKEDLERVKTSGGSNYLSLKNDSSYDFIHPDPRFREMLAAHKKLYEKNLDTYQAIESSLVSNNIR